VRSAGAGGQTLVHRLSGLNQLLNADGIAGAKYGTKTAMVSPPIRNMHTPVEIANLNDLEQCAQLIAHYILSKEGK